MTDYDGKDRPEHYELPDGDERTELRNGIVRALYALPMHFTSPINVEGIEVNDLFSINTLLGGTIEAQTVMLLNSCAVYGTRKANGRTKNSDAIPNPSRT